MKIESKYSINDVVYMPEAVYEVVQVPCPDCLGVRAWWARMPSGEEIAITCPTCVHGYESRGTISEYQVWGRVHQLTIGSVNISTHAEPERRVYYMCIETGIGSGTNWPEGRLYATCKEAKAMLPGLVKQKKIDLDETRARSCTKKRLDGPGSMAAYYREQIRTAKKDIKAAEKGLERQAAGLMLEEPT